MTSWIDKRKKMIQIIVNTMKEKGENFITENMIQYLGAVEGISRRTALDYIKNAQYLIDNDSS